MSYVVLARKYRPKTFEQMVGQDAVVRALTSALSSGRLHHAYLFTGTRGIGKTTVSRILAKSLNCSGPDGTGSITAAPCGVCPACVEIDADRYVDYVELDAASNRGIDEVRDLLERAAYKPTAGRFKVFMIDEAHQLTKDSFSALLKTLEEPPEYLKFVLATTDPQKMLPTVLSRCLQFNLRPIPPETIEEHLATVLRTETVPFEPEALSLLGRAAWGSMRDALSLTDQALAYGQGRLEAAGVRAMIGLAEEGVAQEWLTALAAHDAQGVHAALLRLSQSGQSAASALDAMVDGLQRIAMEQMLPARDGVARESEPWAALAEGWDRQEVQLLYAMLLAGRADLACAPDPHAALLMIAWRFLSFAGPEVEATAARPHGQPLRDASAGPARARVRPSAISPGGPPSGSPARAPEALVPSSSDQAGLGGQNVMERWSQTVESMVASQELQALPRELALQSMCLRIDDAAGQVHLQVASESLATGPLAERLGQALCASTGRQWVVSVCLGEVQDSLAIRQARRLAQRQTRAESVFREDPLVQELLGNFSGARIVPGSIHPLEPRSR